jgi:hypothetical protein
LLFRRKRRGSLERGRSVSTGCDDEADKLGYRLVGANPFGFNTFYLWRDLSPSTLPMIELGEILRHDRNRSR